MFYARSEILRRTGVTAYCSRSDDGGVTYDPGVPVYTTECGGLHGHPVGGADGTVYLPNKNCGGAFTTGDDNAAGRNDRAPSDYTRGGTQYTINVPASSARATTHAAPSVLNFDALAQILPALDEYGMRARLVSWLGLAPRSRPAS